MEGYRKPRIFLCHAKEDKPRVEALYHQLKAAGYDPWFDKYDLLAGQDWWREIERIIANPHNLVVVCLSRQSVIKRGMVQKEIKWALDVLDQMPEDAIYLIPVRLEPCQVPDQLARLHRVDLFEPGGVKKLKQALDFEIKKRQQFSGPKMMPIPAILANKFLIGSDPSMLATEDLTRAASSRLQGEEERAVMTLTWMYGLTPREIQSERPDLFPDIAHIYQIKRNILNRLLRDPEIQQLVREKH